MSSNFSGWRDLAKGGFFRRALAVILILTLLCPSPSWAMHRKKRGRGAGMTAVSAILWNVTTNHYYYDKAIDQRVYPASTTKVMTAILALEYLSLDQYVTVSERATQVLPTKLDLNAGEQYRVRDLMYAVLLKSANDAAAVLAEAVAGSQEKFVVMMNQRARQIGARHTHFANVHGLPSQGDQYTTARDMALMFKEALKNPFFQKAITFKFRIAYSKDGRRHFLKSHNKALFLNWKQDIFGKTGYTRDAQSCFVGHFLKGKDTYIIAVFGCHKRWNDIKFIIERYGKVDL